MSARPLLLVALTSACSPFLPPVTPGFVGVEPRSAGAIDGGAQVGAVSICAQEDCTNPYGGLTGRIEPYADPRLSFPIEATFASEFESTLFVMTRVGPRYRLGDVFAIGAGIGPNFMGSERTWYSGFATDVEFVIGQSFGKDSRMSFAMRPGYSFMAFESDTTNAFAMPMEIAVVSRVAPGVRLGGSIVGGVGYGGETFWGSIGASLVVAAHSEDK